MRTRIIVNPTAGSGKAGRSAELLAQKSGAELVQTAGPGHAVELAQVACRQGVEVLVAVGGDGTFSQVAHGLMSRLPDEACPALALLPAGTGGDYRRTYELDESVDSALSRLEKNHRRAVDVGVARYCDSAGNESLSYFLNVCSFGLGGLTDQIVDRSPKWLGGKAAFFLGATRAAIVHQPVPVELYIDDQLIEVAPFSNVAICLGRYFGGGMKIAPDAQPDDGLFEVITIEGSKVRNLSLAASIYQGTHLRRSGVKHYQGAHVKALCRRNTKPLIDLDGEQLGQLPLDVSLRAKSLQLLL